MRLLNSDREKAPRRFTQALSTSARGIFILLIVSLGWMQPFPDVFGHIVTPTDIIFPLVAIAWFLSTALRGFRLRWHPAFWLFALYFMSMLTSSIYSPDPRTSFIKLAGEAYLIGLAVIGYDLFDSEDRIKKAVYAFLAGAAVSIAGGIFALGLFYIQPGNWMLEQLTYHYGAVPVGNYPRLSSFFVSASMFCNYLNLTAVLLLVARRKLWIGKAVFWIGLGLVILCSVFTISIGLGGVFFAIGIWIWPHSERNGLFLRRFAAAAGILVAIAFFAVSFVALQPYKTAPYLIQVPFINSTLYPSPRLLVWSETLQTFRDNPVTGKGLDMPTSSVAFENAEGSISVLTDAHNTFLSVAAQNGVISLVAMIGICWYLLFVGVRSKDSNIATGLTIAFLTAFVYQGLTGAFEDSRHLWVLIGLVLSASKLGGRAE